MTPKEQKIQNASIRLALRKGDLPYVFFDKNEKTYRKLIYESGKELGVKFKVNKIGERWSIDIA